LSTGRLRRPAFERSLVRRAAAWVEAKASAYWEVCVTSELIAVVALEGEAGGR
jgi:hypothetical protein